MRATQRDLSDFSVANGKTSIPLSFAPEQSFFVGVSQTHGSATLRENLKYPIFLG